MLEQSAMRDLTWPGGGIRKMQQPGARGRAVFRPRKDLLRCISGGDNGVFSPVSRTPDRSAIPAAPVTTVSRRSANRPHPHRFQSRVHAASVRLWRGLTQGSFSVSSAWSPDGTSAATRSMLSNHRIAHARIDTARRGCFFNGSPRTRAAGKYIATAAKHAIVAGHAPAGIATASVALPELLHRPGAKLKVGSDDR
ncbi:hypothetical protein [Candidatus Halocynthiibacter alkanivorans]|uniref:hypothetical protein n=1 Tax=Candidatus Halocynthiibacter alkanivorans TaxID=2267619 RepID=UPI000DF28A6B|nr:hypothetical protein [Candidatus Halocynthiibacter alkanivorans]